MSNSHLRINLTPEELCTAALLTRLTTYKTRFGISVGKTRKTDAIYQDAKLDSLSKVTVEHHH